MEKHFCGRITPAAAGWVWTEACFFKEGLMCRGAVGVGMWWLLQCMFVAAAVGRGFSHASSAHGRLRVSSRQQQYGLSVCILAVFCHCGADVTAELLLLVVTCGCLGVCVIYVLLPLVPLSGNPQIGGFGPSAHAACRWGLGHCLPFFGLLSY